MKMTDRERLIELIIMAELTYPQTGPETGSFPEYLADYLLEHGVIVPPCKSGDTVYFIYEDMILEGTVRNIGYVLAYVSSKRTDFAIPKCVFDESAFLSREEAERKLKERESNA